ncbi:DUF3352 domain-containing protein [Flammeovirga sp. EKP202]|uniref:DUF3352 domain-containing protein n=1 Tax=Flammeovirga sp. EKP202 TaxID=2770592 RepID=UPI00165FA75F|nr:DUF3352 domain-containing protein [Flammeovirga sp. EKP202]MBD0401710.1 hypothetical protein [Flammeovirga sp. EKP202]
MEEQDNTVEELHEEPSHIEEKKPKKSNKGIIFLSILILLFGIFGWWTQSLPKTQLWKTLPAGAGVIIGTSDVLHLWQGLHASEWSSAIEESLTANRKKIWNNGILNNSFLPYFLSDYPSIGAIYKTEKEGRAQLLAIDLGWQSKLTDHLRFIIGKKFTLEQKQLGENGEATVLKRGTSKLGIYFVYNNLLIFSTHETLAKRAYEALEQGGEMTELEVGAFEEGKLAEVWMNPDAIYTLSESNFVEPQLSLKGIGRLLGDQHWMWTDEGLSLRAQIDTKEKGFKLEPVWWMWSGTSSSKELLNVIPTHISVASHWGMSTKVKERRDALMRANIAPWRAIENRLSISIEEDFDSWVGDEAAWVKLMPSELKGRDGEVMLLKTNNPALASEKLRALNEKVEGFTLERFSELKYRGFAIGYIGVEELLPRVYGDAFDRIKRPYYTVLGNAVAFSNHPKSLKRMIDAKLDQRTINLEETKIPKSAMYIWGNGGALYQDLPLWIDQDGLSKMKSYQPMFSSVQSFEMVFLPRAKYHGASYLNLKYGDAAQEKVALTKRLREFQAIDGKKYEAYLDGVKMEHQKAFKIASPQKSDEDNMIKFQLNTETEKN